jgi:hypothetical protein
MPPLLTPSQLALITSSNGLSSTEVFLEFPKRLNKRQWDALTAAVFNHHRANSVKQPELITIGRCSLIDGKLHFQPTIDRSVRPDRQSVKCVFVHVGHRRQPDALMRMLVERQLGFDSMAALPSGQITVREHEHELVAQFKEQQRFAEAQMQFKSRRSLAESLEASCREVVELLRAKVPTVADVQRIAWAAFEAGKAVAWLEGLQDDQLLQANKKARRFVDRPSLASDDIAAAVASYRAAHDNKQPTPKQLREFKKWETRIRNHEIEVYLGAEEAWVPETAFQKRVQRHTKRPRGRPGGAG